METLRGARVLVTGGAGLIGSHLVEGLQSQHAGEIRVYDNFSRGRMENLAQARARGPVTIISGDIRDRSRLAAAMQGIDVLFHLAAIRLTQCAEDPRLALEVMADGTFNVVEAAHAAKVRRVVAASSSSIYGTAERFPTAEDHHPYDNRTIYGAAKTFQEGLLKSFHDMYGLNYVTLRPFNVYGPRMDIKGAYTEVLIRWMERIEKGMPPIIFGEGRQSMDFVFVEDVARAFLLAGTADAVGEALNVASGVETSLNDLARALLSAMGAKLDIEYGPERKLAPVSRRLGDTRRAKDKLGFAAEVGLDEGLSRLVRWWRAERETANQAAA